jgi:hypothetical protein
MNNNHNSNLNDICIKLLTLYDEFFGNLKLLHSQGLTYQYRQLKIKIIKDNLIDLVLYGTKIDENSTNNYYVNIYVPPNGKSIRLTLQNISSTLLNNFFNNLELKSLYTESAV